MSFLDLLLGRPLKTSEEASEKVGSVAGIPLFGLDALSSAAYGPEAALTLLIPLGAAGVVYILPLSAAIILLLVIVYFSYRQTIRAYPTGGGSYTVAKENIGVLPGLFAAAALMIDYILTVAVGISAGVGALVSAVPSLEPHTCLLCLLILAILTTVNLRGVREAGIVFMAPTYLFVGCMFAMIGLGTVRALLAAGHPRPMVPPNPLPSATAAVTAWLLLKAFSSGCTAMTGVEAVSNGVRAFQAPVVERAQRTLTVIIGLLILLLVGIAFLAHAYQIGAVYPGPGYQSVISQLTAAVFGKGFFYYITMASVLLVLSLSANTSFSDFPRLCRIVANDKYLPSPLASRGRRLVYSQGICLLALLSAALILLFGGVTDRLIPLFAVGAFLAFTLSQTGMVMHWARVRGPKWRTSMLVNGLGAVATAITVAVITVSKFAEGAWVTTLLIPSMVILMLAIHHHYQHVAKERATSAPLNLSEWKPPVMAVPVTRWDKVSRKGVEFALSLSKDVYVIQVDTGEQTENLRERWGELVEKPASATGTSPPKLVVIPSPYRFVLEPLLAFILDLERQHPDRLVAVLIPELVERHWYEYFLHNQRAQWLKAALLLKGTQRIVVINVPWYLK